MLLRELHNYAPSSWHDSIYALYFHVVSGMIHTCNAQKSLLYTLVAGMPPQAMFPSPASIGRRQGKVRSSEYTYVSIRRWALIRIIRQVQSIPNSSLDWDSTLLGWLSILYVFHSTHYIRIDHQWLHSAPNFAFARERSKPYTSQVANYLQRYLIFLTKFIATCREVRFPSRWGAWSLINLVKWRRNEGLYSDPALLLLQYPLYNKKHVLSERFAYEYRALVM